MKRTKFTAKNTTSYNTTDTKLNKYEAKMKKFDIPSTANTSKSHERFLTEMDAEEVDICLEEEPIPDQIERSRASYKIDVINTDKNHDVEIVDKDINNTKPKTEEVDLRQSLVSGNLKILKLNKMTWLSEVDEESDSGSCTQLSSQSDTNIDESKGDINDKHLSTIMELDKVHNLFGMSSFSLALSESTWKRKGPRKDPKGPAFPQNMIIFKCCTSKCCKYKTRTQLPTSLRCGGCGYCAYCTPCYPLSCRIPCAPKNSCSVKCLYPYRCLSPVSKCSIQLGPPRCVVDAPRCCRPYCASCRGIKIVLKKKPKYEPSPVEIKPRAPSMLQKPAAARICTHTPTCVPPSSCFPYLMPCYWPASQSAPCSNPDKCFHNPRCLPPRSTKKWDAVQELPVERKTQFLEDK